VLASATSSFNPTNVPYLYLWLRADALVYKDNGATYASNNDTVYMWGDSSGHGNHLTQTTAGSRPIYKTNILNGLPIIGFTNKYLALTYSNALTVPVTYFAVYQYNSSSGNEFMIGQPINVVCHQWYNAFGNIKYGSSDGGGTPTTRPSAPLNTWFYDGIWFNGSASYYMTNGVIGSTNTTSSSSSGAIDLGYSLSSAAYNVGLVAELLVYTNQVTITNAQVISDYLKNKWGL
jgi:hypothetical protein